MNQKKVGLPDFIKMGLASVLGIACLLLCVGVTWSRYRSEVSSDLNYTARVPSQVYLWGVLQEDGSYAELPGTWQLATGSSEIDFTITNGIDGGEEKEDIFAQTDINLLIRIAATEGIKAGENVEILLRLNDENGTFYNAVPIEINENSSLHDTFGSGWLYCFRDTEGKEPQWRLEGGELSALSATLVCTAKADVIEYSMLQLQVIAADAQ